MKYYLGIICFLFISISAFSQNLIVNPGFEEHAPSVKDSARTTDFEINEAVGWYSPTESPARLLDTTASSYSKWKGGDPTLPHSGVSYIALSLYFMGEARSYIEGEFSKPLEANKKYKFSLYMAMGYHNNYTIDELGVYFGKNKVTQNTKNVMTNVVPQLIINIKNSFKTKCQWVEISGYYTAIGGEKYFIVGNFKKQPKNTTDSLSTETGTLHQANGLGAPYLIDDLSMTLSNDKETPAIA
ncbi:MAG TPA: hypothetical protein VFJ43_06005, partial [Bacteroidia bacterium]|nr:hypothetical protein [Bacteroidia bacterium]